MDNPKSYNHLQFQQDLLWYINLSKRAKLREPIKKLVGYLNNYLELLLERDDFR